MPAVRQTPGPPRRLGNRKAPQSRAAPFRWRLIVMAKAPVAGRAKTRIASELGVATAVRFARHSAAALLQRLAADPRWSTSLAVTPDGAAQGRFWPRQVPVGPQGGGDLGARMQRLFDRACPGPVIIVGTDTPLIGRAHIAAAFRLLGRHDTVFGPAEDGGYWLVGLRRRPRPLRPFGGVRWSSAYALADTMANLRGRSVARLPTLCDVDTSANLGRCQGYVGRRVHPPPG
ncbi:MAG: TIGR04282 family arsenosugar biosynthesis glycosyltransferase [Hyphomicrobiaceae bacterium]|nr:TIGR04282 family arsenosugar biosynthesis glycosyltransferase [Hyphomicrobiaceae bacterium]